MFVFGEATVQEKKNRETRSYLIIVAWRNLCDLGWIGLQSIELNGLIIDPPIRMRRDYQVVDRRGYVEGYIKLLK
ncbi:CIC11C00000004837 [Sungouiella intermedia]|uniref:CIC11C00000004837 n=1 Tax=Sungouiella intermedia TaxID=45354 RepID=A0A1L0GI13_9ASCO|nr:CIC11C00000004837 [[Candida] intermedia]